MPRKLTAVILAGILCALTSTSFAGLLDGTQWYWYDYLAAHDMAFYDDHMYVRPTNRQLWERSVLPYSSFNNLEGSITYINFFADLIMPVFAWGRCDMEEGIGSYNVIGVFLYVIPLFRHNAPYALTTTD